MISSGTIASEGRGLGLAEITQKDPQGVRRIIASPNDLAPNGHVIPSALRPTPHDAVLVVVSGCEPQWYRKCRSKGAR